jgi:YebC/PmpR family DNA-binding regulatory protein
VRYEGYGPGGVAILVDTLTDNRTRTVNELRTAFSKSGGNLGNSGCVAYLFDTRGQILISAEGVGEERMMEAAIEAGATDVQAPEPEDDDDGYWTLTTEPTEFQAVKDAIEDAGFKISEAWIAMVPQNTVSLRGDDARKLMNLIDVLEDHDDAQKVYTNADIPDDELAALSN